jgi:L-rhamnose mutarotase
MVERMSRRFALALDLVDDAKLIAEYEAWHRPGRTPTPIIRSILDSGIENMEIYRAGNRMFMIIEAGETYSAEAKSRADAANPDVERWSALMKLFQQPVPAAGPDGTWVEMDRVFRLTDHPDR